MLSIIIPTYNEAENLKKFIATIRGSLFGLRYEIIIVDDNSPDGTGPLAESLKDLYDNLKVIHRLQRKGPASAIIEGTKIAVGDIILTLNADFQHPVEYLRTMIEYIDQFDLVIASRYVMKGSVEGCSYVRAIISRVAIFLTQIFIPKVRRIKDPLSGFFVLKRKVIENAAIHPFGFKCLLEILVKGYYDQVAEVPYIFKNRRAGRSKFSFYDCYLYIRQVASLMRSRDSVFHISNTDKKNENW